MFIFENYFKALKIFVFGMLAILFSVKNSEAAITFSNGKWETTFDCADVSSYPYDNPPSPNCDGITEFYVGTESFNDAHPTAITASANNPNGNGGKGFRKWIGDGSNVHSMSAIVEFPPGTNHIWVRFYIRYQSGFRWGYDYNNSYNPEHHKWVYFHGTNSDYIGPYSYDQIRITQGAELSTHEAADVADAAPGSYNFGWSAMYPNYAVPDGNTWTCFEFELSRITGAAKIWINGTLRASNNSEPTGGAFDWFEFLSNNSNPNNTNGAIGLSYAYVDVDDMVITNTTPPNVDSLGNPYIGPLVSASPDTTAPNAPGGLSVT